MSQNFEGQKRRCYCGKDWIGWLDCSSPKCAQPDARAKQNYEYAKPMLVLVNVKKDRDQ